MPYLLYNIARKLNQSYCTDARECDILDNSLSISTVSTEKFQDQNRLIIGVLYSI